MLKQVQHDIPFASLRLNRLSQVAVGLNLAEVVVNTLLFHQFQVIAEFLYLAFVDDIDAVNILDG